MSYRAVLIPSDDPWGDYWNMNKLVIEHNGEEIATHYDNGEPEDNSFTRDWGWVPDALEEAYKLGFQDAIQHTDARKNTKPDTLEGNS